MIFFMELTNSNRFTRNSSVIVYRQNIRSVTNRSDEISINLQMNHIEPHLICLTEHHLTNSEIIKFSLDGYTLASSFCRKDFQGGGVCTVISNNIGFQSINLKKYCQEKSFEICAIKLHMNMRKLLVFCIYRAP